jgi:Sugar (and other) transporter
MQVLFAVMELVLFTAIILVDRFCIILGLWLFSPMACSHCLANYTGARDDRGHQIREFVLYRDILLIFRAGQLPESPRWLIKHGQHAEAISVISALDDLPHTDPEVQRTYRAILDTVRVEDGDGRGESLRDLFTGGRTQNFRRATLGVVIQCFQQITGINLIT